MAADDKSPSSSIAASNNAAPKAPSDQSAHDSKSSAAGAAPILWLWKNFVDGQPEYWAFDNPYPCHLNGDPITLGEPCGFAIVRQSRRGRDDVSDDQVIAAIKRSLARSAIRACSDIPLCAGHADAWFTGRNNLEGDTSCVACAFQPVPPLEKRGWTSVSDGLPEDQPGRWLTFNEATGEMRLETNRPSWWNLKDPRGKEFDGPVVTHWREDFYPLPKARADSDGLDK